MNTKVVGARTPLKIGEDCPTGSALMIEEGQLWLAEPGERPIGVAGEYLHRGQEAAHEGDNRFFEFKAALAQFTGDMLERIAGRLGVPFEALQKDWGANYLYTSYTARAIVSEAARRPIPAKWIDPVVRDEDRHLAFRPHKASDAFNAVMDRKEALLRGWIAYVALCNPASPALTPEFLQATFGEWIWRDPEIVRERDSYEIKF